MSHELFTSLARLFPLVIAGGFVCVLLVWLALATVVLTATGRIRRQPKDSGKPRTAPPERTPPPPTPPPRDAARLAPFPVYHRGLPPVRTAPRLVAMTHGATRLSTGYRTRCKPSGRRTT